MNKGEKEKERKSIFVGSIRSSVDKKMICFILVLAQQRQQQQQWQQQKQQQKQQQQLQQQQLAGTSLTNEREQRGENLRTKIITRSFCPTELLRIIT